MGGGAGVSVHGGFRIATENSVFVSLFSFEEFIDLPQLEFIFTLFIYLCYVSPFP